MRWFSIALLSAALGIALTVTAVAETIQVRGGQHPGFGRLVFDWSKVKTEKVEYTAKIDKGFLVVRFERPFDADLSRLTNTLDKYVASATREPDGKTFRFGLKNDYRLRTARYGRSIALDLQSGDTRQVDRAKPSTRPVLKARFGDHPGFSRVVFDWKKPVPYTVRKDGNRVTVDFDRPADVDLSHFNFEEPEFIEKARSSGTAARTTVVLDVPAGAELKHFRDGPRVAIDIRGPRGRQAVAARPTVKKAPVPVEPKETQPAARDVGSNGVSQLSKEAVRSVGAAARRVDVTDAPSLTAAFDAPVPVLRPLAKDTGNAATLALSAHRTVNGLRVAFPWQEQVAAAVFERGGHLWVVFDQLRRVDLSGLGPDLKGLVGLAEQLPSKSATVLRFRFDPALHPTVSRDQASWIVDMTKETSRSDDPIFVDPQPVSPSGPRVFLPVVDTGKAVKIDDPEVGDKLVVVPVSAPGRGVNALRRFVQFSVLATSQGVAVQPTTRGVIVRPRRTGVSITNSDGLLMSRLMPNGKKGKGRGIAEPEMFRYEDWKRGPEEDFAGNKHEILYELSIATANVRNKSRLDLARLYFAHDRAEEALGVLTSFQISDPRAAADPKFRALRGATLVKANRLEAARSDLFHPDLDENAEVALWRGLLASQLGEWDVAHREFAVGMDALSMASEDMRAKFRLAMIETALAESDTERAARLLKELEEEIPSKTVEAWAIYDRARLAHMTGALPEALAGFEAAAAGPHRPTEVRAKRDRIRLLRGTGEMTVEEAIDKLETLRFAWRGDEIELELLDWLGQLYIESKQFREGLTILRQAVAYFPNAEGGKKIAKDMNTVFGDLFLNGAAGEMAPINALGLYYDFRELTPVGPEGDEMIRRLADRLVTVDLLPRAAELLEHQVNFRLQGQKKAEVGTRLAIIYLLDRKPEPALRALRTSRWPAVPEDLKRERRHLEARALTDLDRFDQALDLLTDDSSEGANVLRADLHWRAKDWSRAATAFDTLLGERWKTDEPLRPLERQQVMQLAISLALGDQRAALQRVKRNYQPKLEGLPEADAFQVVADTTVDRSQTSFRNLASAIAQVNQLEAFMTSYRERLKNDAKASAIN